MPLLPTVPTIVRSLSPVMFKRVMPTADKDVSVLADVPELTVSVSTPEVAKEEPTAVPLSVKVAASVKAVAAVTAVV